MLSEIFFLRLETLIRSLEKAPQPDNARFVSLSAQDFRHLEARQPTENEKPQDSAASRAASTGSRATMLRRSFERLRRAGTAHGPQLLLQRCEAGHILIRLVDRSINLKLRSIGRNRSAPTLDAIRPERGGSGR